MSTISYPIRLSVTNYLNGENWIMCSVDDSLNFSSADYERLVAICNEQRLYEFLFKEKLDNKPYGLDNALSFESWAKDGWKQQKYFVFIIKDANNEIAAALDIKSDHVEEAEIGYWASETERGVITNAVAILINLAKQAGYRKLYANVRKTNHQSQGVLNRLSFTIENEFVKNGHEYYKFEKILT